MRNLSYEEKEAFAQGYAACWDSRMNGKNPRNPYIREESPARWQAWKDGFDRYLSDLETRKGIYDNEW